MQRIRGEEQWVRACLQQALPDVDVRLHDDGSRPGMHDFDLVREGRKFAAVEVTAAADAVSLELWKLINGGDRWVREELAGGWMVALEPTARAKRLRSELPKLLARLEAMGIPQLSEAHGPTEDLVEQAERFGVVSAYQSPSTEFPGSIYCTISLPQQRSGGWVPETGDAFAHWVGDWLTAPNQADNLGKLQRSGADERHLFLLLPGFTTAPFEALDPLMRPNGPLPTVTPHLPEEITHLWAMSSWNAGDGFHWSPTLGWTRFRKIV
ncbi:hypothetical protein ACFQ6U_00335 [Streptomyces sp. NPDC056465]|uniref:hypothetical protein n=1 Tax=Streptomyces sp. NPDC056465 TaxID=3345829 RepID=UPI0036AC113F